MQMTKLIILLDTEKKKCYLVYSVGNMEWQMIQADNECMEGINRWSTDLVGSLL
jgi:hypothetical protein